MVQRESYSVTSVSANATSYFVFSLVCGCQQMWANNMFKFTSTRIGILSYVYLFINGLTTVQSVWWGGPWSYVKLPEGYYSILCDHSQHLFSVSSQHILTLTIKCDQKMNPTFDWCSIKFCGASDFVMPYIRMSDVAWGMLHKKQSPLLNWTNAFLTVLFIFLFQNGNGNTN